MSSLIDMAQRLQPSYTMATLAGGVIAIIALQRALRIQKDPREPPYIPSAIPFVGHIINLLIGGANYFAKLE